jgi:uncharacterized membrane protein
MVEKDLSPARVEAFSDGVIAIIITIMVLELHVPADPTAHGLALLWPTLVSYALSYVLVAIYWVNHHHLFSVVRKVDVGMLWTNIALLFFLSLMPFFTAWVGQSRMASFPVLCYATTMLLAGASFMLLQRCITLSPGVTDADMRRLGRSADRKVQVALTLDVLAMIAAYWHPKFSMVLIVCVAASYLVPGSWIESQG